MTEPLEPRPITRSLKDENKIGSLWGFVGIDKRQVWVMMALLFGCFLIWSVLELFFNLNAVQVAAIFVPLSVIVMAFSLLKLQGRYMDFWLRRGIDRALKPQRLKWRRKPPGKPGYLRDSVQSLMPQDQLYWQMLRTVDGQYVMVFELELVTLSLTSDAQRAAVERASQQLYNRAAGYDWQEMMIGTGRDTKLLARRLQHKAEKTIHPGQTKRLELAKQRARFYAEIGAEHGAQDRRAYLVLPLASPETREGRLPGSGSNQDARPDAPGRGPQRLRPTPGYGRHLPRWLPQHGRRAEPAYGGAGSRSFSRSRPRELTRPSSSCRLPPVTSGFCRGGQKCRKRSIGRGLRLPNRHGPRAIREPGRPAGDGPERPGSGRI